MDRITVMSWVEGLAEPGWRDFHSDSEVQNIAKSAIALLKEQEDALEQMRLDNTDLRNCNAELLKEQEAVQPKTIPTELKQKMWNALYAEEDEYEKKFVGKEEHLNWFAVYRPWLQKGFGIAINAIADWEGQ